MPTTACTAKVYPKVYGNMPSSNAGNLQHHDFDVSTYGTLFCGHAASGTTLFGTALAGTRPFVMKLDADGNVRWGHVHTSMVSS